MFASTHRFKDNLVDLGVATSVALSSKLESVTDLDCTACSRIQT